MNHEAEYSEQLQAAIEALASGQPREAILSTLPPGLHAMAETGAVLARAGQKSGDLPGAGFLLGLEEQLRTDLRLRPSAIPTATSGSAAGTALTGFMFQRLILTLVALGLVGTVVMSGLQDTLPGEAFYGLKRRAETARRVFAWQPADAAELRLDEAWRRLLETEALLASEEVDLSRVEGLLGELSACYDGALTLASEVDAPRILLRADGEARVADQRLERLTYDAPPEILPAIGRARAVLAESRQRLAGVMPFQPVPIAGGQIEVPEPVSTLLPTSVLPSESPLPPVPSPTAPPASPTAEGPPASATAPVLPTLALPSDTPRVPPPSSTPPVPPAVATQAPAATATSQPGVPPTDEPKPTSTRPAPEPTGTNAPADPPAQPTWTSEPIWPTDPPEPTQPSEPPSPEPPASPEPGGGA